MLCYLQTSLARGTVDRWCGVLTRHDFEAALPRADQALVESETLRLITSYLCRGAAEDRGSCCVVRCAPVLHTGGSAALAGFGIGV